MVAGGCDLNEDCSVAGYVEQSLEDVERADLVDCGALAAPPWNGTPDERIWREARACVLTAIAAERPYVVTWEANGIEGGVDLALAWRGVGHRPTKFIRAPGADGRYGPAVRTECVHLTDHGECSFLTTSLCLDCFGSYEVCGD